MAKQEDPKKKSKRPDLDSNAGLDELAAKLMPGLNLDDPASLDALARRLMPRGQQDAQPKQRNIFEDSWGPTELGRSRSYGVGGRRNELLDSIHSDYNKRGIIPRESIPSLSAEDFQFPDILKDIASAVGLTKPAPVSLPALPTPGPALHEDVPPINQPSSPEELEARRLESMKSSGPGYIERGHSPSISIGQALPIKTEDTGPAPMPSAELTQKMAGSGSNAGGGEKILEALAIVTAGLNRKAGPGDMVKMAEMFSGRSGGGVSPNTAARISSSERGRGESRAFRMSENEKNRDLQRELADVRHQRQVELRGMNPPKESDIDLKMSRERLNNPELMEILHLIDQVSKEGSDLEATGMADPAFVENKRARIQELFNQYKAKESEIRTRKMESDAAKRLRK